MYLSFHRCTNARVCHQYPANGNSVTLEIEFDGGTAEITIYDLPVDVTDKFRALRDQYTTDHRAVEAA